MRKFRILDEESSRADVSAAFSEPLLDGRTSLRINLHRQLRNWHQAEEVGVGGWREGKTEHQIQWRQREWRAGGGGLYEKHQHPSRHSFSYINPNMADGVFPKSMAFYFTSIRERAR